MGIVRNRVEGLLEEGGIKLTAVAHRSIRCERVGHVAPNR